MTTETYTCPKCSGNGRLGQYIHIADGVCFQCSGTGKLSYSDWPEDESLKSYRLDSDKSEYPIIYWFEEFQNYVRVTVGGECDDLSKEDARKIWKDLKRKGYYLRRINDHMNNRYRYNDTDWQQMRKPLK